MGSRGVCIASTRTEQENVESLLYVSRHRWGFNAGINIYCKWSHLHVIREMLCQVNELENFKRTCFGHIMDVEAENSLFCTSFVHNLMLRRINKPDAKEVKIQQVFDTFKGGQFQQGERISDSLHHCLNMR
ncbi:Uncharacterized protein TCM_025091 [Theobroma cacao]|uniref:Uncharacterized protein n=1 Tax=Theobroma cacao TaxID=3641 RepID=A0A061EY53_THECC|nr:Uncharacterized protein TCM_025091 [Theobroma cacao]